MQLPNLNTERLLLRPFLLADASDIQRLAGDREIADTTLNIPHPYEDGMAEAWIAGQKSKIAGNEESVFAITLKTNGELVGAVGLRIDQSMSRANLGYWIGKQYWNSGYCTEAAQRVVEFGFQRIKTA